MKITNLDEFLQELGKEDLLSAEEEQKLLKIINEKGTECPELEKLVNANLRYVVSLALQYQNRGLDIKELIPIGVEGLKKVALTYDLDDDTDFLRQAVQFMRKYFEDAVKTT